MWSFVKKPLAYYHSSTGSVTSGAALELGQWRVNHGRVRNLFQRVLLSELGVGIALGVLVADACDLCEVLCTCTVSEVVSALQRYANGQGSVLLHVFPSSVRKVLRVARGVMLAHGVLHHLRRETYRLGQSARIPSRNNSPHLTHGTWPVGPYAFDGAW